MPRRESGKNKKPKDLLDLLNENNAKENKNQNHSQPSRSRLRSAVTTVTKTNKDLAESLHEQPKRRKTSRGAKSNESDDFSDKDSADAVTFQEGNDFVQISVGQRDRDQFPSENEEDDESED